MESSLAVNLTELQKEQLDEAIEKHMDDAQPEYEFFRVLEGNETPSIRIPGEDLGEFDELEDVCLVCGSIPYDYQICSNCLRSKYCAPCIQKLKYICKARNCYNDGKGTEFVPVTLSQEDSKRDKQREMLAKVKELTFECQATQGEKLDECSVKMNYEEIKKHLYNHHRPNQYKCTLPGCNHKGMYLDAQTLANMHWRRSCNGFQSIYKFCEDCGFQEIEGTEHNCVKRMCEQVKDFDRQVDILMQEVQDKKNEIRLLETTGEGKEREEKQDLFSISAGVDPLVIYSLIESWRETFKTNEEYKQKISEDEKQKIQEFDVMEKESRGPERCDLGHSLELIKNQQLMRCVDDQQENQQLVTESSATCKHKDCVHKKEGVNPKIDFLNEEYYACTHLYDCFFAVHYECYGGQHTLARANVANQIISDEQEDLAEEVKMIDQAYGQPKLPDLKSYLEGREPEDLEMDELSYLQCSQSHPLVRQRKCRGIQRGKKIQKCNRCKASIDLALTQFYHCDECEDEGDIVCLQCATCEAGHTLMTSRYHFSGRKDCARTHVTPMYVENAKLAPSIHLTKNGNDVSFNDAKFCKDENGNVTSLMKGQDLVVAICTGRSQCDRPDVAHVKNHQIRDPRQGHGYCAICDTRYCQDCFYYPKANQLSANR